MKTTEGGSGEAPPDHTAHRKPDFVLPSAEGQLGYPPDMLVPPGSGEAPAGLTREAEDAADELVKAVFGWESHDRLEVLASKLRAALRGPVGQNDLGNEGATAPERTHMTMYCPGRCGITDEPYCPRCGSATRRLTISDRGTRRGPVGGEAGRDGGTVHER